MLTNDFKIDVAVVELTSRCDLNCLFCPQNKKKYELHLSAFKNFIKENMKLKDPIPYFELGGIGNPLLHKKIEKIFQLLKSHNVGFNIVTNGLNLNDIVAYFDDSLLQDAHFSIYLDSINEEKNDYMMGKNKAFKKTIESIEYLLERNFKYDILMRINSENCNEIEQMLGIAKFYRCNLLIPMETFPFVQNKGIFLTDEMKSQVIGVIDKLRNAGEPVHKVIHFEQPRANCTYLRKKRLFINSRGKLAFCHFISCLKNTEISSIENKNLLKLIQINNRLRDSFFQKKEKELKTWKLPRKNASPCSYCLHHFGGKEKW
jgi:MoaA/NifB/PqqE/SkfB family radical SAM enzyme